MNETLKILKLTTKNIMGIQAVEITPDSNVITVGGKNGQGKTSLLESIVIALGGKKHACKMPLREGEKKGEVSIDLGKYIVDLTIPKVGSWKIQITDAKTGTAYPSPQTLLDSFKGDLTFDPLAFSRMDLKEKLVTLQKLLGLDFSQLNLSRKNLFDTRTISNREVKSLQSQLDSMPYKSGVTEEVVISELISTLQEADTHNKNNETERQRFEASARDILTVQYNHQALLQRIEEFKKDELAQRENLLLMKSQLAEAQTHIDGLVDIETDDIKHQFENAEKTNQYFRDNQAYDNAEDRLKTANAESESLTDKIIAIDADKIDQLAKATFPIDGMSFDEDGIYFNDLPLDQASSAEQLRIAVAMAMAMNPELRIMLVRDGSLLDENSLKMLCDAVQRNDYQLWLEVVREDETCSVIIEGGQIKEKHSQAEIDEANHNDELFRKGRMK